MSNATDDTRKNPGASAEFEVSLMTLSGLHVGAFADPMEENGPATVPVVPIAFDSGLDGVVESGEVVFRHGDYQPEKDKAVAMCGCLDFRPALRSPKRSRYGHINKAGPVGGPGGLAAISLTYCGDHYVIYKPPMAMPRPASNH
ncbi:hypothetical protein Bbelb_002980 [Branchiostoma belcheri]|nr:hypothetical protein Bbelb_002980 [Branchiostoma belcheri]